MGRAKDVSCAVVHLGRRLRGVQAGDSGLGPETPGETPAGTPGGIPEKNLGVSGFLVGDSGVRGAETPVLQGGDPGVRRAETPGFLLQFVADVAMAPCTLVGLVSWGSYLRMHRVSE